MRILIAEDNPDVREALRLAFSLAGWTVFTAKDGREALRVYHQEIEDDEYFDVLLLDVLMPRLNGYGVGINIRNLEERFQAVPRARHVYLTGHDEEMTIHGEELTAISFADAYFKKPIQMSELVEKVTELVNERGQPG